MSNDSADDFFALPAFKPDEAALTLRRQLRDVRSLSERSDQFELRGHAVVGWRVEAGTVVARIAKRPAVSPEWQTHVLKSSADLRKFMGDVKKRVASWQDDER